MAMSSMAASDILNVKVPGATMCRDLSDRRFRSMNCKSSYEKIALHRISGDFGRL